MYGLDGSYGNFVTYLYGYDAGTQGSALLGFREWLLLRLDQRSSLVWSSLVTESVLPGLAQRLGYKNLDEAQNRIATEALFRLLSDFLRDRDTARDPAHPRGLGSV
jgi:hypothetical protein